MKSAIMLVLSLSIIFDAYAQRTNVSKLQSSNTVIAIHYFAGGGNFNVTMVIGSDSSSMIHVAHGYRKYLPDPFVHLFCLNKKSVDYISQYISTHCNPVNNRNEYTSIGNSIRIISKKGEKGCYIMEEASSRLYYQGLIEWIEKSPYKNDCKNFVEDIEPLGKK